MPRHKMKTSKPSDKAKFDSGNREAEIIRLRRETALLKEEIRRKDSEVEALSKISAGIAAGKYLEEILGLIVTITAETMGTKICSIMLLNEEKQELEIKATQSLSGEYRNKPNIKIGQSISGRVVKEKKPVTVVDVTREPGYMYPGIAKKEGICSMLAVPMMIKEKVIGVINAYTANEHEFTEGEIRVLQSVANQAAVSIENTKLMQETVAAREALEVRKVIERAKGILMKELGINEEDAYKMIHKKSMDSRRQMKEVAEAIILSHEIRDKGRS